MNKDEQEERKELGNQPFPLSLNFCQSIQPSHTQAHMRQGHSYKSKEASAPETKPLTPIRENRANRFRLSDWAASLNASSQSRFGLGRVQISRFSVHSPLIFPLIATYLLCSSIQAGARKLEPKNRSSASMLDIYQPMTPGSSFCEARKDARSKETRLKFLLYSQLSCSSLVAGLKGKFFFCSKLTGCVRAACVQ